MSDSQVKVRGVLTLLCGLLLVSCASAGDSAVTPSPSRGTTASTVPTASATPSASPLAGGSTEDQSEDEDDTGGSTEDQSDDADDPGGSGKGEPDSGGSSAVESPLRIPLPTDELGGAIFKERVHLLHWRIAEACGGTQCITVAKVGESLVLGEGQRCDVITDIPGSQWNEELSPYPFVEVPRGGTLRVYVNVRCEDASAPPPVKEPAPDPPPTEEPAPPNPPPAKEPAPDPPPSGEAPTPDSTP